MRALIDLVVKYRKIPGIVVRLIRGVDQRFIEVEYDQYLFDRSVLFVNFSLSQRTGG